MDSNQYVAMIPTVGRVESLERVLDALDNQKCRPGLILICISANHEVVKAIQDMVNLRHVQTIVIYSEVKSSAIQRNVLLEAWQHDYSSYSLGLFVDDDTYPAEDYASRLIEALASSPKIGGASGVTFNKATTKPISHSDQVVELLACLFALHGSPGRLLRSGVNIGPDSEQSDVVEADWLFACSLWRQDAVRTERFPKDWMGYAVGEDVWFSSQVADRWELVVDPKAKLHIDVVPCHVGFAVARDTVLHQFRVMVRRPDFRVSDIVAFFWSVAGRVLFDLWRMIRVPQRRHLVHLLGTIAGAMWIIARPFSAAGRRS